MSALHEHGIEYDPATDDHPIGALARKARASWEDVQLLNQTADEYDHLLEAQEYAHVDRLIESLSQAFRRHDQFVAIAHRLGEDAVYSSSCTAIDLSMQDLLKDKATSKPRRDL